MEKCWFKKYTLQFTFEAGTSRGIMQTRDSWFVFMQAPSGTTGIGECAPLPGLSVDDISQMEAQLRRFCENGTLPPVNFPSVRFGIEMAQKDLQTGGTRLLFPSDFTRQEAKIPINGLVWMGPFSFMRTQIIEKIKAGFTCIKIKIGAIEFEEELALIRMIRHEFAPSEIEIRVDANGAFNPSQALEKLKKLSEYGLHSIEQPIRQNQWELMAELCEKSPLPIALDEELIGIDQTTRKEKLLAVIKPQYIILKPSLLGGFAAANEWIKLAAEKGIGWWVTSALESNMGLNAIAQWTYTLQNPMPQGLGTGQLFSNNFRAPLTINNGFLQYLNHNLWDISKLG